MIFSWDDVAVFLALHKEHTTGRAAALLGCSQPTVVRRIAALEAALGVTLFERRSSGFSATPAALALLPAAQNIEQSIADFEEQVCTQRGDGSRVICLTLLDHFEALFAPILRQFRGRWPDVRVDMLASDRIYDLARGEADIALRGRALPNDDTILVRQLPDCAWTLYVSVETPEASRPTTWEEARTSLIALPDGAPSQLPVYRRLAKIAAQGVGSVRCTSYNAMRSTITSGTAISALPVTVGDNDAKLARCFAPPPELDVPIYLLGRRASLRRPHVRDLFDHIHAYFASNPNLLNGRP